MTVRELCALADALETITNVGTALLNAPRMQSQRSPLLTNAAGDLLDEKIDDLNRLREAAIKCLSERDPAADDAELRARTLIAHQVALGAEVSDIVTTAEALAADAIGFVADVNREAAHG